MPAKQPSPNGKIVFQSTQGGDGFTNDIYVMDADGKHQTRLTDDVSDDMSAVWSPQGDRIAFLSARRGNGYEIYLMNADGSNQHPLRDASPAVPFDGFEWSPNGTRLAYGDGSNVWVVAAEGTDPAVNVSLNKAAGSFDREPSWSPNGGQLVVRNFTACPGCSDLYIVNSFGGAVWSPDGTRLAFKSISNNVYSQ